jgi:hypothetical protein
VKTLLCPQLAIGRRFIALAAGVGSAFLCFSPLHASEPDAATPAQSAAPSPADPAYVKKIDVRTEAIVTELKLTDGAKAVRVHAIIRDQYYALNTWHESHDPENKKSRAGTQWDEATRASLQAMHDDYLRKLATELTAAQIEQVKDLMTYNKVQFTYGAYCTYLPMMSDGQKAQVLSLLKTAREEAMDGGSVEDKNAVFTRYKGKINNYLSSEHLDVGKAEKAAMHSAPADAVQGPTAPAPHP